MLTNLSEQSVHSCDRNRTPRLFFGLSRTASGIFGSLAAAEPRAAAARFRRARTTILGPRRASLLAASRNLEWNECCRSHHDRIMLSLQATSHRKNIECWMVRRSVVVVERSESLQTASRYQDFGRYRQEQNRRPTPYNCMAPD